jgi:hypothetical protein
MDLGCQILRRYPSAIISDRRCMGFNPSHAKVKVPKELAYQDIDTRDIGILEVEKVETLQVSK